MSIRMRCRRDLEVVAIEAVSDATPYDVCPEAAASLQTVVGMKIGSGWTYAIKRRLVGAASCTHLAEMLIAMGTAAYQTVVPYNRLNGKRDRGLRAREEGRLVLRVRGRAAADETHQDNDRPVTRQRADA